MKKNVIITIRVDERMHSAIQSLAEQDERTLAWMARKLIEDALQAKNASRTK